MAVLRSLMHRVFPALLVAILFGALAPQGFMPQFGPDGLTIELCSGPGNSGLGNKATTIARDDPRYQDYLKLAAASSDMVDHDPDGSDDNPMPPCAFAGLATLAVPHDPVTLPQMVAMQDVPPALHHSLLRARHHAATPPATGPPALT